MFFEKFMFVLDGTQGVEYIYDINQTGEVITGTLSILKMTFSSKNCLFLKVQVLEAIL